MKPGPKYVQEALIYGYVNRHSAIVTEVATALGFSSSSTGNHLAKLHRAHVVFIEAWRPSERGGPPLAVYRAGMQPDAPRPPKTRGSVRSIVSAEERRIKRAAERKAKAEADERAARVAAARQWIRRDPLVAFLFGPAPV